MSEFPSRRGRHVTAVAAVLSVQSVFASPVSADDKKSTVDRSVYTLLNPTPDSDLRDYNPDRPAKITSPFTIDAGRIEVESDFVSFQHSHSPSMSQDVSQVLDPTFKLGLLSNVDIEFGLNGLDVVHQVQQDGTHRFSGFGDVNLRAKVNLIGNDGGDVTLAVVPYVKLPAGTSASLAIGNDAVEGGGILTAQIKLPLDFQLGLQTEVDALQGGNDSRRHPNFVNIATLSHEVPGIKNLTAYAEFYSSVSQDRYTPDIYTADFALAYLIKPNTQLDAGINVGLNRAAPDYQVYTGISQRF